MNDPANAGIYPAGPQSAPISYWHLWAPIFQRLEIDPANIPDFAPWPAPQNEGLPAWQRNNGIYEASSTPPRGLLAPETFAQPDPQQVDPHRRRPMGLLSLLFDGKEG